MKCLPGPVIRMILFFGGGTRGLDCNYGWTMKVQLRFWNVSFLTEEWRSCAAAPGRAPCEISCYYDDVGRITPADSQAGPRNYQSKWRIMITRMKNVKMESAVLGASPESHSSVEAELWTLEVSGEQ